MQGGIMNTDNRNDELGGGAASAWSPDDHGESGGPRQDAGLARWRIALEGSDLGLWDWDITTGEVFYSVQWARMLGLEVAELGGRFEAWSRRVHPEDLPSAMKAVEAHLAGETELYDCEHRMLAGNGEWRWIQARGRVSVRDPEGRPLRAVGTHTDITARKHAEAELVQRNAELLQLNERLTALHATERSLEESQTRFRLHSDTMPLIVWSADPDGSIDYSNRHFFDYTGVSEALPAGTRWQPSVHPGDLPGCLEIWSECVQSGKSYQTEFRLRRGLDGAYRWFRVQAEPARDAAGRISKWYGTAVDIHEIKELERESRLLADKLASMVGSIADGFLTVDRDWRITFLNGEAERSLERRRSDVIGRVVWEEFPEAAGSRTQREFERAMAESVTVGFEEFYPWLGRWFEVRACPMDGGLSVFFRDVTERHEAEEKLREQAALLDKAQDAILVRGLDHRILYWNKSAERLYGWSAAEAVGASIMGLLYRDASAFMAATNTVLTRGEWVGEIEQYTRSGRKLIIEGRWTLVRGADDQPLSIFAINTDITERKQIEAQFFRAQRLESIGTLAGGIAHDLNNVLAPILMSVDLLRQEEDPADREKWLDLIATSAHRGADMIQQVLSFARGVDGRRVDVQVRHLVRDVLQIVRETFARSIEVRPRLPQDLWPVVADPTQIHQVLLNLCVNARDAMPQGGILEITAENQPSPPQGNPIPGDGRESGEPWIVIHVSDTGTGMTPEVQERIFDPFFTTKAIGKGTGLGLSTSAAIVKSHGGFIRVQSEPGRGSRFSIHLPAAPSEAGPVAVASVDHPRGRGECVLLVDDEAPLRTAGQSVLERFGYRVLLAVDGVDALAVFALHRADIDLVITDRMMPVMDGWTAACAMRRMKPEVPVILTSGLEAEDGLTFEVGGGWSCSLRKPYTVEVLLQKVREALEAGRGSAASRPGG